MAACKRSLDMDDYQISTKQSKHSITGYVSRVPNNVLLSPTKQHKKGTEYFNFCLTTESKRYRCVSFCKQHLTLLTPANNNKELGCTITDYTMDKNDIKLNSYTILKIIPLKIECKPVGVDQQELRRILELPVDSDVSVTCLVTSHNTYEAPNCVVHNYILSDKTGSMKLSAFEKLPLEFQKSYIIEDLSVNSFKNEKLLKWMVNSIIIESKQAVSAAQDATFIVTISQFNKGQSSFICEKCSAPIEVDEGLYICICNHISTTAKKVYENALVTIVHHDGRKQTLSFEDPTIFNEIGEIDSFGAAEYKFLLKNKFRVAIDGSKLISLSVLEKEKEKQH